MSAPAARASRVVIVGGGVSGLATAYRLTVAAPELDVVVLEAGERHGGKIRSVSVGDLQLPAGADSFLARKPWAVQLCKELGLGDQLETPGTNGAYVWTDGGLVAFPKDAPFGIPGDVGDVFHWPGLSKAGRRRAAQDLVRAKRKDDSEESLGGLLRRRLGDEATDLAVAPLLAGLFAGDVDRLGIRATFPELAVWEASQGSLIRGSQAVSRAAKRSGGSGPMFTRPRGGVERLTDELAARLGARVRTGQRVAALTLEAEGYVVQTASDRVIADAVVLASEAHATAPIAEVLAPRAASELAAIRYASTGVVLCVYEEGTARGLPSGTGFVIPRGKAPMTASTWLSSKWPSEVFGTRAVVRSYVGADGDQEVLQADDDELIAACARFQSAVVTLPERPEHAAVVRWNDAMPQYEVGHVERVARIRAALPAGIFVTGQAYDGVGIPDRVRGADQTAQAVAEHLAPASRAKETVP